VVGAIVDGLGDPKSLPWAMSITALGFGIPAIAACAWGLRGFRAAVAEMENAGAKTAD
jgi:hypothetical protein